MITSVSSHKIPLADIDVLPKRRALVEARVLALMESFLIVGQTVPILCWRPDPQSRHQLVAGLHRLEAAKRLGWEFIDARIIEGDEIGAKIAEIDENLCRSDLSPAEEVAAIKRRKELIEAKERKVGVEKEIGTASAEHNGDLCRSASKRQQRRRAGEKTGHDPGSVRDVALKMRKTYARVQQSLHFAKILGDTALEEVIGTPLDTRRGLAALCRLTEEERAACLQKVRAGEKISIRAIGSRRASAPRLQTAWQRAKQDERIVFLSDPQTCREIEKLLCEARNSSDAN